MRVVSVLVVENRTVRIWVCCRVIATILIGAGLQQNPTKNRVLTNCLIIVKTIVVPFVSQVRRVKGKLTVTRLTVGSGSYLHEPLTVVSRAGHVVEPATIYCVSFARTVSKHSSTVCELVSTYLGETPTPVDRGVVTLLRPTVTG